MDIKDFIKEKDSTGFIGLSGNSLDGLISTKEKEKERVELSKTGKLPQGLKTGYEDLDRHWRYKLGNLFIINGHANVGKSFKVWYLMLISYKLYGWKWIMFCAENNSADIRIQLAEFLKGKLSKFIDYNELNETLDLIYDAFTMIDIDDSKDADESLESILNIVELIIKEKGEHQGLLIDPYNSIDLDVSKLDRRLSTHDLHYMNAKQMRKFAKKHNMTVWVNMHAVSESLRKVDNDGFPKPPNPSDTEGGGKWINRADEFATLHRYVQDSARNKVTEIHIRKVKDTKTGGMPSDLNNPIQMIWKEKNGFHGFYDGYDYCALNPESKNSGFDMPKVEKFPDVANNFDDTPF
jgi:hypothetical protein